MNRRIRKKHAKRLFQYAATQTMRAAAYAGAAQFARTMNDPVAHAIASQADELSRGWLAGSLATMAQALALTSRNRPYQRVNVRALDVMADGTASQDFSITFD
jgi:O-methyltransferase involved in polyketide biosynthesis